jgi:hypothetical protein
MKTPLYSIVALLAVAFLGGCATIQGVPGEASPLQTTKGDPYMGDWEGSWGSAEVCAQVIALGNDTYHMNLLSAFDTPDATLAVLDGKGVKGGVDFSGNGTGGEMQDAQIALAIRGKKMTGSVSGAVSGSIAMNPVVRLSPSLGAQPPRNAIVLFDGSDLAKWEERSVDPWGINVKKAVGGENRAAYLRTWVFAPAPGKAQFAYGVDDGAKVWLNGNQVHSAIEDRKVTPCRHKVAVDLVEGWNFFLVKVVQNDKDWGFTAKLRGLDASPLAPGFFVGSPETEAYPLESFDGNVALWEASGAYTQEGKTGADLMDVAFPPEQSYAGEWKPVPLPERPEPGDADWLILGSGAMEVRGGSIQTKQKFIDQQLHVEFRTPFMPAETGQKRGNSGVFLQNRYEVQVLDSYGLSGENNECGGLYKTAKPRVNMCAPPLQWQTYDITFHAARYDVDWKKVKDAIITVIHNGVTVHENQPIPDKTTGSQVTSMSEPGSLSLQDHGNPVWFRNIWLVELPPEGK